MSDREADLREMEREDRPLVGPDLLLLAAVGLLLWIALYKIVAAMLGA